MDIPSMYSGRIGIKDYLKGVVVHFFVIAVLVFFRIVVASAYTPRIIAVLLAITSALLGFLFTVVVIGMGVRRLHDRGHSGRWIILYVISAFYIFSGLYVEFVPIVVFVPIIFFIYLMVTPGNKGENLYGHPVRYSSWWNAYVGKKNLS